MMDGLTGFKRDLLYVIAGLDDGESPPYGLAIKAELDQYYADEINHGQLYPNLDALVERGLVEKGAIDKRTNFYGLTDQGRHAIEARREWEQQYIEGTDR